MKKFLFFFFSIFLFPLLSYAALVVVPSSAVAGSSFTYSGAATDNDLGLYFNEGSQPVCYFNPNPPASGDVFNQVCGYSSTSTAGNFELVGPNTVGCSGLSYSACASANTGIPGTAESDFVITSSPPFSLASNTILDWSQLPFAITTESLIVGTHTIEITNNPFESFWVFFVLIIAFIFIVYKISCMVGD